MTIGVEVADPGAAGDYVCGVPVMVVETEELLREEGVDEERIHTVGWGRDAAGA